MLVLSFDKKEIFDADHIYIRKIGKKFIIFASLYADEVIESQISPEYDNEDEAKEDMAGFVISEDLKFFFRGSDDF